MTNSEPLKPCPFDCECEECQWRERLCQKVMGMRDDIDGTPEQRKRDDDE